LRRILGTSGDDIRLVITRLVERHLGAGRAGAPAANARPRPAAGAVAGAVAPRAMPIALPGRLPAPNAPMTELAVTFDDDEFARTFVAVNVAITGP
jgi:hypothetical protein